VAVIWIYTLVFAFSSLWFAHFCLAALQVLRAQEQAALKPDENSNFKSNSPVADVLSTYSATDLIVDDTTPKADTPTAKKP
jgi:hypothetical protein